MTTTADTQAIVRFVRGTLGCGCPDEVFNSISIERPGGPDPSAPYVRLLVGNRLLIYVLDGKDVEQEPAIVPRLASRGRHERDRNGLNRFRLVIGSERATQLLEASSASFAAEIGHDERAHLHVIASDLVPVDLHSSNS